MTRAILVLLVAASAVHAEMKTVNVLAAVSLSEVVTEAGLDFQRRNGVLISASFAGSPILAKQVEAGAPADVMISADEAWMDYLESTGHVAPGTRRDLCENRLVLISQRGANPLNDWKDLGRARRIAVADPTHVPAGRYAKEALESLGLWRSLEPKLLAAMDVRAALAYVERGEAEFGIVYATDVAVSSKVAVRKVFPEGSHRPIRYSGAVLSAADNPGDALAFLDFLSARESFGFWKSLGFLPVSAGPEDATRMPYFMGLRRAASAAARRTGVPVALPAVYPGLAQPKLYAEALTAERGEYEISLGLTEGCKGGACGYGDLAGRKADDASPAGTRNFPFDSAAAEPVRLASGFQGRFVPSACGANCDDAKVYWLMNGFEYMVGIKAGKKEDVLRMADSAITGSSHRHDR